MILVYPSWQEKSKRFMINSVRLAWLPVYRLFNSNPRALLPASAEVHLPGNVPVSNVDKRYLSFSIDISVLAGGFWWEGSNGVRRGLGTLRVAPLQFNSRKLDRFVQNLGPAYLRIGGSEADKIHYFEAPKDEANSLVLTRQMWDNLHQFVQRNNLKLVFTVKYGLFKRQQQGDWRSSEMEKLFEYCREKNYLLDVCELGNELNAYWAFYGLRSQPGSQNLARDYATFIQCVKRYFPNVRIMGPGSAFWPKLGETIKPFPNITQKFLRALKEMDIALDIVDWHYYPFQSTRSPLRTRAAKLKTLLNPNSFEDFAQFSERLTTWRDAYQPGADLWTGETGSAQCGGQPKLSDRWASCFWWADQLGRGALLGQKVMIRQSLIGGDYGLIDRLTLKPRPDYWISWMWMKLMGTGVFPVESPHEKLRIYCHQHPENDSRSLLIINVSNQVFHVKLADMKNVIEQFELSAKKLTSKKIKINGIKPSLRLARDEQLRLNDFPAKQIDSIVAAYSINFWRIRG